MTNKEIAQTFNLLGKIMELHDENPFKIKSYTSAYITLRKVDRPLLQMSRPELDAIPGVGKAIAEKIEELQSTGELQTLKRYMDITPPGVREMLQIKGFGPKKIKVVWKELGIETIGELKYAIEENRLIKLKGFGLKTQETLSQQLVYFLDSKGKYLYATVEPIAMELLLKLEDVFAMELFEFTGALRRKCNIIECISLVSTVEEDTIFDELGGDHFQLNDGRYYYRDIPVEVFAASEDQFYSELFLSTATEDFLKGVDVDLVAHNAYTSEEDIFEEMGLPFIVPEQREKSSITDLARSGGLREPVAMEDIKGVVHNHSTYSDGMHSIKEMADYCIQKGYQYLVMSDHSKAAFYANGLDEDLVMMQFREIDKLNQEYENFKIFKSIECDILNDGSLDYADDFLKEFDLVICSIHSNLKMDADKANHRLLTAISHPSCHILGHMTSRLLLSREGYPVDHRRIIDACAKYNTVIELNANPSRLDMDWEWIEYALSRNVMIAINPDAHSREQIDYIHYGVCSARKGGLTADQCLNSKSLSEFQAWVDQLN